MKVIRYTSIPFKVIVGTLLLGGCVSELSSPSTPALPGETGRVELKVAAPGALQGTKSATLSRERQIINLSVFLYDEELGFLENSYTDSSVLDDEATVSSPLLVGEKSAWVYANYDIDPSLATRDNPVTTAGLDCNSFEDGRFAMRGRAEGFTVEKDRTVSVPVTLERVSSRIVVSSVRNNLPSGTDVILIGAYLSDVLTKDHLNGDDLSQDGSDWINHYGRNESGNKVTDASSASDLSLPQLTAWYDSEDGLPALISNGTTYTPTLSPSRKGPRLYYIPGVTGDPYHVTPDYEDPSAPYSITETKLVLVTRIDGVVYYYPVPITETRNNQSTEYSIILNSIGSTDPALPCKTGSYTVSGNVKGWEEGKEYSENPDGTLRPVAIYRTGDYASSPLYIAQRLNLSADVSACVYSHQDKLSFELSVTTADGQVIYDNNAMTLSFDRMTRKWNISYPCIIPGTLNLAATDPKGREVGVYSAEIRPLKGFRATLPPCRLNPRASTTEITYYGYETSPGVLDGDFVIANAGTESGGNKLDLELYNEYLIPTVTAFDSPDTEDIFSVVTVDGTRQKQIDFTIVDYLSGSDAYNSLLARILWEDALSGYSSSDGKALVGSVFLENGYSHSAILDLYAENPWDGLYEGTGFLKYGYYYQETAINSAIQSSSNPCKPFVDFKNSSVKRFPVMALPHKYNSNLEYELLWCQTSSMTSRGQNPHERTFLEYYPDGNSIFRINSSFGLGNASPFPSEINARITAGRRDAYDNIGLFLNADSNFSSHLNAGGWAYVNAKVSDGNGNVISFPMCGVTFVKTFVNRMTGYISTNYHRLGYVITPNPYNYPDGFLHSQWRSRWKHVGPGAWATGSEDVLLPIDISPSSGDNEFIAYFSYEEQNFGYFGYTLDDFNSQLKDYSDSWSTRSISVPYKISNAGSYYSGDWYWLYLGGTPD